MVGPVWREPEQGTIDNFSAVWADDPGFDPRAIMRWTAKLHSWMSDFFGDESAPPYRVFMRFNPMNARSEEHTSELQSLMRISYAVFCLKKKNKNVWRNN